jgi:hypothetical protein
MVSAAIVLVACGGGGGGDSAAVVPFAPLSQYTMPTGTRIDASGLDLFPFHSGDTVTYDRLQTGQANGTVVRSIVDPAGTGSIFNVTETDSTTPSTPANDQYIVATLSGVTTYELSDPLHASGSAPGLFNTVTVLAEYETPLFPVGSTLTYQAQGDLGADADGDGKSDSYRFVWTQLFVGLQTMSILGASRQVAHFTNTASFTVRGTEGNGDVTVSSTEDTYFASHIGLVRRDTGATLQNGTVESPAYSIQARSATVGGISYP